MVAVTNRAGLEKAIFVGCHDYHLGAHQTQENAVLLLTIFMGSVLKSTKYVLGKNIPYYKPRGGVEGQST